MRLHTYTVLVALAGIVSGESCEAGRYTTVKTSNGPVTGHAPPNTDCVVEYLGIAYAKPPVGELRFAAPAKITEKKAYNASSFGYDCPLTPSGPLDYPDTTPQAPRIVSYFASGAGTPQSEDCLTLNIWSKATKTSHKADKPVLVFFYGGRFAIGNTDSPFYNGKYFADAEDIVVITVNYRINIFGFPGAPGQTQNLGLRDQRAALEWIRENIATFGGSPSKITISGQSAGGVSVDYWAYAYKEDPIVHGIIGHSGNAFSFPVNDVGIPEKNWNTVVEALQCNGTQDVMACMRKANWTDIEAAAGDVRPTKSSSVLRSIPPFYPMPDQDVVFTDYLARAKKGDVLKVPILMGNNNNEDGYYRIPAYANGIVPTDEQVEAFLLESFTCPVAFTASTRTVHGIPAWTYRYMADWDNTRLYPTSGAYHGVDLHMIFGASEDVSGIPPSEDQKRLTRWMQHAWYSFCNDPRHGLEDLGWHAYDPNKETLALLGHDNHPLPEFSKSSRFDSKCLNVTLGALG